VFDTETRRFVYANAGHQPTMHWCAGREGVEWLRTGGAAVGLLPEVAYETEEVAFGPGDVFLFYTDGITDAEDASGLDFGHERLAEVVRENRDRSARAIVSAVHSAVESFRGPEDAGDDATVIVVRSPTGPA